MKTGVRSIVPRDAWKIWSIVGLALAAWLAVLSIGIWADEFATSFRGILGLSAGRTARWLSACCFLAAAQLSFLILWHRSRSRKDFWGRFRLWYWAGLVWLALAVAEGASLHILCARWLEDRYRLKVWNGTTVCWMLAVCPVVIGLMRLLRREMHQCRQSSFLLRGAAGVAAVSAAATLAYPLLPQTTATALFAAVAWTLWPLLLACSLLMHARFVIHVTNDVLVTRRVRPASRIAGMAWRAGASVLRSAISLPWTVVSLTPVSRLWRRRKSGLVENGQPKPSTSSSRRVRSGSPGAKGSEADREADRPSVRPGSMLVRLLGAARRSIAAWSERRAARAVEREALRETAAAGRRAATAAKAEARRIADAERLEKQGAEKAEREAAKLRVQEERRAAAEKAKADREAADHERAAQRERAEAESREKNARERAARDEADRARESQRVKDAAAREAEKLAQAAKAAAAKKPVPSAPTPAKSAAPAPQIQPKVEVPRPKGTFERPAASPAGAIKPQHVSFSDDDESDEDDTKGMSRKERKRQKKLAKRGEAVG